MTERRCEEMSGGGNDEVARRGRMCGKWAVVSRGMLGVDSD